MAKIKNLLERNLTYKDIELPNVNMGDTDYLYPVTVGMAVFLRNSRPLDTTLRDNLIINTSLYYGNGNIVYPATINEAITSIHVLDRSYGKIITFKSSDGWEVLQYNGESLLDKDWINVVNWKKISDSKKDPIENDFFELDSFGNLKVKNNRGLYSSNFISARGADPTAGSGGGLDYVELWTALGGTYKTDERVSKLHLPIDVLYSIPVASSTVLGGIKIGTTLSMSNEVLDIRLDSSQRFVTDAQINSWNSKLDSSIFTELFEKVNIGTPTIPVYAIKAKFGLFTEQFLSARGSDNQGGQSGGIDYVEFWNALGGAYKTNEVVSKNHLPNDILYGIPIASSSTIGGIKVGNSLSILNSVLDVKLDSSQRFVTDAQINSWNSKLDSSIFTELFEKVNIGTNSAPIYAIKAKFGLFTEQFLSARLIDKTQGGGGLDRVDLFNILSGRNGSPLNGELISATFIPDLINYGTKSWINQTFYNKVEIDSKLTSSMKYKGSKQTFAELPTGATIGDVWNVVNPYGDNYAWDGTKWDKLGSTYDFSIYAIKTTTITAGVGITGGGSLANNMSISLDTVGVQGTYSKVIVDVYGRVTGSQLLIESDIPNLSQNKIIGLSIWKNEVAESFNSLSLRVASLEDMFEVVNGNIHVKKGRGLYTESFLSARGADTQGGGSGGIDWGALINYDNDKTHIINQNYIPFLTIDRITSLQSALDGKQAAGSYAAAVHSHNYATQVIVGTTGYNISGNTISIPAYPTTLPASDVYEWAKAAAKPLYGWDEITGKPTTFIYDSDSRLTNARNPTSTRLYENTDLNTITTVGFYYCPSSYTVTTFLNCPTTNAFSLIVTNAAGNCQRLTEYMTSGQRTWFRNYYAVWGLWYQEYDEISGVPWLKITGKPTTVSGFGITDVYTKSVSDSRFAKLAGDLVQDFSAKKLISKTFIIPSTAPTGLVTGEYGLYGNPGKSIDLSIFSKIRYDSTIDALVFDCGIASLKFISARGADTTTSSGGGLDIGAMWIELDGNATNKIIGLSRLPVIPYSKLSGTPNIPAWALQTNKPNYTWNEIGSKPTTFTPSSHTHTIANITSLQSALDGKQAAGSYALSSSLNNYLPISGGTLTGALNINGNTVLHAGNYNNYYYRKIGGFYNSTGPEKPNYFATPGLYLQMLGSGQTGMPAGYVDALIINSYISDVPWCNALMFPKDGTARCFIVAQNPNNTDWGTKNEIFTRGNANKSDVDWTAGNIAAYGYLRSILSGYTISIGSQNNGYCHYETTAPTHWFNKPVYVQGDLFGGSGYNRRLAYVDEIAGIKVNNAINADALSGFKWRDFPQQKTYNTSSQNTGWYKIKLPPYTWMVSFTVRIYQDYNFTDIVFSGYQYGTQYWHAPKAKIITSSLDNMTVHFGYDGVNQLWVAVPAGMYTGLTVLNFNNGYATVNDWANNVLIENQATLTGTIQSSQTLNRPLYMAENATVSNLTVAGETYTGGWFRTTGDTGWYSHKWGGGIYMVDNKWVRTYGSKGFLIERPHIGNSVDQIALKVITGYDAGGGNYDCMLISSADVATLRIAESDGTQIGICAGDLRGIITSTHNLEFHVGAIKNSPIFSGAGGRLGMSLSATGDLTVASTISATVGIYTAGYLSARGVDPSDINKKDNITPLHSTLEYILNTKYKSFTWKDNGELSVGIIAQDEQPREFGCLVRRDLNGSLAYSYTAHVALVGKAVQDLYHLWVTKETDQDKEIRLLKEEVKQLKQKLL